jgi:GAF domain-containing protein
VILRSISEPGATERTSGIAEWTTRLRGLLRARRFPASASGRRRLVALVAGVTIALAIAGVDLATGSSAAVIVGTLGVAPVLTALLGAPAETLVVAAVAVLLASLSGIWDDTYGEWAFYWRLIAVGVVGAVAIVAAAGRQQRELTDRRFDLLMGLSRVGQDRPTLQQAVDRLGGLLVPEFADVCIFDVARDRRLERLSVKAAGPRASELEAFLTRRGAAPASNPVSSTVALASGEALLLERLSETTMREWAQDEQDLRGLRALRINSSVVVPLQARGQDLGVLTLIVTADSNRRYGEEDLEFATVLSGRAALALDNAGLTRRLTEMERRLVGALGGLAEAVIVHDHTGRIVYANEAAGQLLRVDSLQEVYAGGAGSLMGRFRVFDEDGRPVSYEQLPASRILCGERKVDPMLVRNVVVDTGEERWLLSKCSEITDENDEVISVVNVIEDVTDVKRAELASRLLAEASGVLASSLDYEYTLQRVAELAVSVLADWCTVSVPDERGVLRRVAVANADAAKTERMREMVQRWPERVDDERGVGAAFRDGQPRMANDLDDAVLVQSARDEDHLRLLRELGLTAAIVVPLSAAGRVTGVMSLVTAESGRRFGDADLALAEELGRRAGTAIENARLYTERARVAATLQEGLRPPPLTAPAGWELAAWYRPAGGQSEVGGDFYDVFETPEGLGVVMGDVTGHGAAAARLTGLARYTLRTAAELTLDPLAAMGRLNATLIAQPELSIVTAICAHLRFSGGHMAQASVVVAGHPLPVLLRDGDLQRVGAFGTLAGAWAQTRWQALDVELRAGDTLVFFTDGVTDARGRDGFYEEWRLMACLREAPRDPAGLVAAVQADLTAFQDISNTDDIAVLALRFVGVPSSDQGPGSPTADEAASPV